MYFSIRINTDAEQLIAVGCYKQIESDELFSAFQEFL